MNFDIKKKSMRRFKLIWLGQFVSIMGTSMTKFALMIWAYQQVGKASTLAFMGFFSILPYVLFSPLAGSLVDRYNKKIIMILSDFGAVLVTASILFLHISGNLEIWHLYFAEALTGAFEAFQIPAYTSAITLLIPKEKYSQASGMRSFASSVSKVFAPVFAGFLLSLIGISGIMITDIATFFVAITTLLIIKIPYLTNRKENKEKLRNIWEDIGFGISYIYQRRGLFLLLLLFVAINLIATITYFGILPAMILARSGSDKIALATVQSMLGIGGVVGSLIVSIWGVPEKKILTILVAAGGSYLLGDTLLAVGNTIYIWGVAAFLASFFIPFIMAADNALWQFKVEPGVQGRVFSIKGMMQTISMPIGYVLGGILADYFFEPAMLHGSILNKMFGWIVGTGTGSGMALMFLFTGISGFIVCIIGYFIKDIRNLEVNIQDHNFSLE